MEPVNRRGAALKTALALTCVILLVEFAGGLISHSLAVLSDAGHVLTDVFALGLAWFAVEQSKRPADRRRKGDDCDQRRCANTCVDALFHSSSCLGGQGNAGRA